MNWFIILGVLLVIVAVAVATSTTKKSADVGEADPSEALKKEPHVVYRVPEGQDPVVVLSHVREAGYTALPDEGKLHELVVIGLREDTPEAREDVRRVVAGARETNIGGPEVLDTSQVRFEGEPGAG